MMKLGFAAIAAAVTCTAIFTLGADPANARNGYYCCYRPWLKDPGVRRYRLYRSPRQYRPSPCGYGDCACIRGYALSTGSQVWWDRYNACTG